MSKEKSTKNKLEVLLRDFEWVAFWWGKSGYSKKGVMLLLRCGRHFESRYIIYSRFVFSASPVQRTFDERGSNWDRRQPRLFIWNVRTGKNQNCEKRYTIVRCPLVSKRWLLSFFSKFLLTTAASWFVSSRRKEFLWRVELPPGNPSSTFLSTTL